MQILTNDEMDVMNLCEIISPRPGFLENSGRRHSSMDVLATAIAAQHVQQTQFEDVLTRGD